MRPGVLRSGLAGVLALAASCTAPGALISRPPAVRSPSPPPAAARPAAADTLDFALAFAREPAAPAAPQAGVVRPAAGVSAPRRQPFALPGRLVRVLVKEGVRRIEVRTAEPVSLAAGRAGRRERLGGRISLERSGAQARVNAEGERPFNVALPCTLAGASVAALLALDSGSYRGSLVLLAAGAGLSAVNALDVEEYLRGVVPLELGVRDGTLIEALKAQAVAARTYACRKMVEHQAEPFDLYATVSDQVYGGALAADSVADRAIRETAGVVAAYGDSLIHAFYHSTCGGRTAAAHEVWDKVPEPYLLSVDDADAAGRPFCAGSRYAAWKVTWTREQLASILGRFGADAACEGSYGGALKRIEITARCSCGRVARLRAHSAGGTLQLCGDRTRFGLRRPEAGSAILPSSRFSITAGEQRGSVTVSGSGYGHGVGLCQTGALGRAAAGQGFAQILQTYYPGCDLRAAVVERAGQAGRGR